MPLKLFAVFSTPRIFCAILSNTPPVASEAEITALAFMILLMPTPLENSRQKKDQFCRPSGHHAALKLLSDYLSYIAPSDRVSVSVEFDEFYSAVAWVLAAFPRQNLKCLLRRKDPSTVEAGGIDLIQPWNDEATPQRRSVTSRPERQLFDASEFSTKAFNTPASEVRAHRADPVCIYCNCVLYGYHPAIAITPEFNHTVVRDFFLLRRSASNRAIRSPQCTAIGNKPMISATSISSVAKSRISASATGTVSSRNFTRRFRSARFRAATAA